MVNLGGSELVTLELIDYFIQHKTKVILYCAIIGGEVEKILKKKSVTICLANKPQLEIDKTNFDYVIIHHSLIPESLLWKIHKGKFKGKIIWQHMSSYLALENPFLYKLESDISDIVLFNSKETEKALSKRIDISVNKKLVFANPVPDSFYQQTRKKSDTLKKVLVISNHPPDEVIEALGLLNKDGVKTEIIGLTSQQKIVDAKLLRSVDVVISIGKTVQYCIAVGTPVYCYDHFGGPGYLHATNFGLAKKYNFSGRGFKLKTVNKIYKEVKNMYLNSQIDILSIRNHYGEEFKLSNTMQTVFAKLNSNPISSRKTCIYDIYATADITEMRVNDMQAIYSQNAFINRLNESVESNLEWYKKDLDFVKNSKSWKLTKPLRSIQYKYKKLLKIKR